MSLMYYRFAKPWAAVLDFSDDMRMQMYKHESLGTFSVKALYGEAPFPERFVKSIFGQQEIDT